jgi:hypothetical protein
VAWSTRDVSRGPGVDIRIGRHRTFSVGGTGHIEPICFQINRPNSLVMNVG